MIFTDKRVPASGSRKAKLAVIGMAPAREEMIQGKPFVGPSGKILDSALYSAKVNRHEVFVTNVVNFFVDTNNLFDVPPDILQEEVARVKKEMLEVRPNCVFMLGVQTIKILMGLDSVTKWRGSILEWKINDEYTQKVVVGMHPAAFIRGQWKWLPIFRYIDLPRAVAQSQFREMRLTKRNLLVNPSYADTQNFLASCWNKEWLGFDYEGRDEITCIGLGYDSTTAMCIPLTYSRGNHYWSASQEASIWRAFALLMQNPNIKKIAQNASFEWIKSWGYGVYPYPLGIDTMHLHHCLYPDFGGVSDEWSGKKKRDIDNPGHGLAFIISQYTDISYYKDDGRHWDPSMGDSLFWEYNCKDVVGMFEAAMAMKDEAEALGLWETYNQIYRRPFLHAERMEWQGVDIDKQAKEYAKAENRERVEEIKQELYNILGYHLNVNSPPQMQKLLYKDKGYQVRTNKKTGRPTTDKETLQYFASKKDDNVLNLIMEMRHLEDLYGDVLNQDLHIDGRMHTHYKIGGTDGTRWSSTKSILGTGTNLQNLPRKGIGRNLFIP